MLLTNEQLVRLYICPEWYTYHVLHFVFVDCMPNLARSTTELAYNPTTSKGMVKVTSLLYRIKNNADALNPQLDLN